MAYSYSTIKTQQGFLKKGFQNYKLINMSINLVHTKTIHEIYRHETYWVVLGQTDDFSHLEFVTYDHEEPLTTYLNDNPSGLYQNLDGYRRWGVTLVHPTFSYRPFTFNDRPYVIIRITDAGLVYNLLMAKYTYETPFVFTKVKMNKTNLFNLMDLLNLGLLGRQVSYNLATEHILRRQRLDDEQSVARVTFENPTDREGMEKYRLCLSQEDTLVNIYDYKKVIVKPYVYDLTDQDSIPGLSIELVSDHERLEIEVDG